MLQCNASKIHDAKSCINIKQLPQGCQSISKVNKVKKKCTNMQMDTFFNGSILGATNV